MLDERNAEEAMTSPEMFRRQQGEEQKTTNGGFEVGSCHSELRGLIGCELDVEAGLRTAIGVASIAIRRSEIGSHILSYGYFLQRPPDLGAQTSSPRQTTIDRTHVMTRTACS